MKYSTDSTNMQNIKQSRISEIFKGSLLAFIEISFLNHLFCFILICYAMFLLNAQFTFNLYSIFMNLHKIIMIFFPTRVIFQQEISTQSLPLKVKNGFHIISNNYTLKIPFLSTRSERILSFFIIE